MKRSLLITLALVFSVTTSSAQFGGKIGVYGDADGTQCDVVDNGGLLQVHFIHSLINSSYACMFKLDISATTWTHLEDVWEFPFSLGNSITGMEIWYPSCVSGPIYLGLATFMGSSAAPCTQISIVPYPKFEVIKAVTCDNYWIYPTGGRAIINPDPTCDCSVPVEETTWGHIKALYE